MKWKLSWGIPIELDIVVALAFLGAIQIFSFQWKIVLIVALVYIVIRWVLWVLHENYLQDKNDGMLMAFRSELSKAKAQLQKYQLEVMQIVSSKPQPLSAVHYLDQKFDLREGTYAILLKAFEGELQEIEKLHNSFKAIVVANRIERLFCSRLNIDLRHLASDCARDIRDYRGAEDKARSLAEEVFDQFSSTLKPFLRDYSTTTIDWQKEITHLRPILHLLNELEKKITAYQFYDVPPLPSPVRDGDWHVRASGRQMG